MADEPIATPGQCLDEPWRLRIIPQRPPQFMHTDHEPAIAYRNVGPNGIQEGGFRHQLARMV
jgi:hypothetical protein